MYGVWFSCLWEFNSHSFTKAFCLINSPLLTACLDSLSQLLNVASLSLFYCYFHADCSSEIANCMLPHLLLRRCIKLSTSYPYFVHLCNARVNQYLHSFIPCTGKHWNFLPLFVFLSAYDLNSFKRVVKIPLTLN